MRTAAEIQNDIDTTYEILTALKQELEELRLSSCPIKVGMVVKRTKEWRRSLIETPYLVTELRSYGDGVAFVHGRKGKKGGGYELRAVFVASSDNVEIISDGKA